MAIESNYGGLAGAGQAGGGGAKVFNTGMENYGGLAGEDKQVAVALHYCQQFCRQFCRQMYQKIEL